MKRFGLLDLDGTLVLSEEQKQEAHLETIEHLGGTLPSGFVFPVGASRHVVYPLLIASSGIEITPEAYRPLYKERYAAKKAAGIPLAPGAMELLTELKSAGLTLAIITSSSKEDMEHAVQTTGIDKHVDLFVSADHVQNHKPHPEPYLHALEKLRAEKDDCFILEDTELGIEAGTAAGIHTYAIKRKHNTHLNLSKAHAVLDESMLTSELVKILIKKHPAN